MFLFVIDDTDRSSEPPKSRSNSRRPSLSDEKEVLVLQVINLVLFVMYKNRANKSSWILIGLKSLKLFGFYSFYVKYFGRDRFNHNFWKFRSKTQWISLVQPEKFQKNGSTFWGGLLFPVGPVRILVEWIKPFRPLKVTVNVVTTKLAHRTL